MDVSNAKYINQKCIFIKIIDFNKNFINYFLGEMNSTIPSSFPPAWR